MLQGDWSQILFWDQRHLGPCLCVQGAQTGEAPGVGPLQQPGQVGDLLEGRSREMVRPVGQHLRDPRHITANGTWGRLSRLQGVGYGDERPAAAGPPSRLPGHGRQAQLDGGSCLVEVVPASRNARSALRIRPGAPSGRSVWVVRVAAVGHRGAGA